MMERKPFKWGILQPLTGGMYFGTRRATGDNPRWIISYPGLNSPITDKQGNLIDGGNEYHLTTYLKKKDQMPPYYVFNDRKMFETNLEDKWPIIVTEDGEQVNPDFEDMDLVVAVPVCAGLSTSTNMPDEKKVERNCNMLFLAKYALNVIRPKVYIFENAPTLMGVRGDSVRAQLERIAEQAGYGIAYYKTNTQLHHNCQRRIRTFVYFFKGGNVPKLGFENEQMTVQDFMAQIPENATQKETITQTVWTTVPLKYIHYKYGENWREKVRTDIFMDELMTKENQKQFLNWLHENCDEKEIKSFERYVGHVNAKRDINKGWWVSTPKYFESIVPACMHKNVPSAIHFKEDRLYNIREWLTAMGMPYDFEMQGLPDHFYRKMGQNVPAGTAQFIVEQALPFICGNAEMMDKPAVFFDNTKQKIIVL